MLNHLHYIKYLVGLSKNMLERRHKQSKDSAKNKKKNNKMLNKIKEKILRPTGTM